MSAWLFERLDAAKGSAGGYADGPYRVVLHTTETTSDPRNWVPGWQYPSHIVCDPDRRIILQCIPLDEAAKALYNGPGGVQTNLQSAIQVEINGRAAEAAGWPAEWLEWLGREVLAPIARWCAEQGSPVDLGDIPEPGAIPNSARDDAPQRMEYGRWNAFAGVCGHRHVPENDHWDGGGLDMRTIALHAIAALNGTSIVRLAKTPQREDEDMARQFRDVSTGTVWMVSGLFKTPLNDDALRQAYMELGLLDAELRDVNPWTLAEFVETSPEAVADERKALDVLLAKPSATGNVDAAALAEQIAGALGKDMAKAVADELTARLAA